MRYTQKRAQLHNAKLRKNHAKEELDNKNAKLRNHDAEEHASEEGKSREHKQVAIDEDQIPTKQTA